MIKGDRKKKYIKERRGHINRQFLFQPLLAEGSPRTHAYVQSWLWIFGDIFTVDPSTRLSSVWYFILIVPAFSQHQWALWLWAGSLVFLHCWVAFWPVVFSLVLFIYLLIYVNLCLSHPILIEIICVGLIQFMLPLYSQLMLWRTADYTCSSFWCIIRWELETQYLGLTRWCSALQPVLKQ